MAFETIDLTPKIGTEIKADRQGLLDGCHGSALRRVLEARGVLVFRGAHFSDEEQKRVASSMGKVASIMGDDGVQKISLDPDINPTADYLRGAFFWHIDGTHEDVPSLAAFLGAKRLPSSGGGDTEFANTYAAYEALSDEEKAAIADLKVLHSLETSQQYITPEPSYQELMQWRALPPKVHPLVWTHRSGRKSLVLGATASHVIGMDRDESKALLCRLRDLATQRHNVYRHEWTEGDMLVWDNTGTMHRVLHYDLESGRLMHRTSLEGEEALI